jgi:purine nucleosidase
METKRVVIDCDPAIGVKSRDVDDGLAILLLLASPDIKLEGITVNFGNVKAPLGYKVAKKVVEVAGADTPVFIGAHSKEELGRINPAVEFLIETVNSNPGEISLVAVGPLTNVATAMMIDDHFASSLKELVVMGGTFKFPVFSFFGEFNFHSDGKAASRVMQAPIPKTLITMDVCSQAVFQDRHLSRIRDNHTRVSEYLAKEISPWLKANKRIFFRKKGFFPWDPVAASYLLNPALFDKNPYTFTVSKTGYRAGRLLNPKRLDTFDRAEDFFPVNLPLRLDGEGFLNLFLERLLSL